MNVQHAQAVAVIVDALLVAHLVAVTVVVIKLFLLLFLNRQELGTKPQKVTGLYHLKE
jgi:hypothetical protein